MTTVKGTLNVDEAVTLDTTLAVTRTTNLIGLTTFGSGVTSYSFPTVYGSGNQILKENGTPGDPVWTDLKIDELADASYSTSTNSLYLGASSGAGDANSLYNVGVGYQALDLVAGVADQDEGNMNTCIGYQSGNSITAGYNVTCIGHGADASSNSAANEVNLGDSNVTALRCGAQSLITLSDGRDKIDVVKSSYGLDFVESLRPVQYTWDKRVLRKGDENFPQNGKKRIGFIAQELKAACGDNGNEILDLVYESNPERLEVRYGNLIPVLTKAIQELKAENNALSERLSALENAQ
jgi:hypothetical protein